MSVKRKRVAKMETSLAPTDAVLLWMKEAQSFGSLEQYVVQAALPTRKFPRNELSDRIEQAVREAMKGQPREQIERAIWDAVREADFLFLLAKTANYQVIDAQRVNTLQAGLLAEQVRHLLEQDAVSNEMNRLLTFFADTAYPLDAATAAAVEACQRHNVTDKFSLGEVVESWVVDHFIAAGKTGLPPNAYPREVEGDDRPDAWTLLIFDRPTEDELLKTFNDNREAYRAFRAGEDYTHGLADVTNTDFQQVVDRVHAALAELVAAGTITKGVLANVATAITDAFVCTPLVDGEWIDRTIVELAEIGWFLERAGLRVEGSSDPHPLHINAVLSSADEEEDNEATFDQIAATYAKVRDHVAAFTGRTKQIDGRDYLSFADYSSWKNRKAHDFDAPLEGIVTATWNAWVDAQDGRAELDGVKVSAIDRTGPSFVVLPDRAAFADQQRRREQIDRLQAWTISKTEVEGPDFVRGRMFDRIAGGGVLRFDRVSYQTKVAEWRSRVLGYAGELFRTEAAIRTIERKYFNGHVVLWPDIVTELNRQIGMLHNIIDVFNETVAFRLARYEGRELLTDEKPQEGDDRTPLFRAGFRIDLNEVRRMVQPLIATTVNDIVHRAKLTALWDHGDRSSAA